MSSITDNSESPETFEITEEVKGILKNIMDSSHRDSGNLIQILQDVQGEFTYLPESIITYISKDLNISEHMVYGVATFYSQFKFIAVFCSAQRVFMK